MLEKLEALSSVLEQLMMCEAFRCCGFFINEFSIEISESSIEEAALEVAAFDSNSVSVSGGEILELIELICARELGLCSRCERNW